MNTIQSISALRLIQAADDLKARLSGEFSSVHGLSVNEFLMLCHLDRAPLLRLPRVELAKRMRVSASTVTRMAAPMEKTGLLTRQVDERDARLAFVVMTETGRGKLEEAQATFAKHAGYAFEDRWSAEELEMFSGLLSRLTRGAQAALA